MYLCNMRTKMHALHKFLVVHILFYNVHQNVPSLLENCKCIFFTREHV